MVDFTKAHEILKKNKKKIKEMQDEILQLMLDKQRYKVFFNTFIDITGLKVKAIDNKLTIDSKDGSYKLGEFYLTVSDWKKILDRVNKNGMSFKTEIPVEKEKNEEIKYVLLNDESKLIEMVKEFENGN